MLFSLVASLLAAVATVAAPAPAAAEETPGTSLVRSPNTFYAYVGAGENLDLLFTKVMRPSIGDQDVLVSYNGPGGESDSCTIAMNTLLSCGFTDLTSTVPGVWTIDFQVVGAAASTSYFDWDISVQNGTADVPGRVWSSNYQMAQMGARDGESTDFDLFYLSREGFLYQASYTEYNGVDSSFNSDAAGNTLAGTCTSAYLSYQDGGDYGQGDQYDTPGNCGDPYKIFFERPAADMPPTATWPDGTTRWLNPPVTEPSLNDLTFAQPSPTDRSGTFTVDVANFSGQMEVQIDVDGNGSYGDPVDVTLPLGVVNGDGTVNWNGLDGEGNPVPYSTDLTARAVIDQVGEIHFVGFDVERRGGLEVTALNGPETGSQTIYWDDTELRTEDRACVTPDLDGTMGVSSTGGVHGWDCSDNTNDGVGGSWGDTRRIDDWTYHAIDETLALDLPGLPELEIEKSSTATAESRIGDTVEYTVEVTNNGPGDYTAEEPARIQDDLSGVLDDATYGGDVRASSGTVAFDEPRLMWEGPLASGDSVTITYSVELTGAGDLEVDNVAFQTFCAVDDPECVPPVPQDCVDGTDPATGLPCDVVGYELPRLAVTKSADATEIPAVGETVSYTVTAENTGTAAFTATRPAVVIDDLSEVLDDATVDTDTLAADLGADPSFAEPLISWAGELAPGEVVTISYDVTYTGEGDTELINVAFGPQCGVDDPECTTPPPAPDCDPADENGVDPVTGEPCGRVSIPGALLDVTKDAEPDKGTTVLAGEEVTYTLTFTNSGTATAAVEGWTDDLTGVVDDARVVGGPTVSDPALSVTTGDGGLGIDGTVPAGESYTVTYTVQVRPDGERGDDMLANFVLPPGVTDPPAECADEDPLCTYHPVPVMSDSKAVDPVTGTTVQAGQELTYTLSFTNEGNGQGPVDRVDDLTHILDDAQIVAEPTASDDSLTASEVADGRFSITGTVGGGETVTVTYTVRVNDPGELGDAVLANFLLDPEEETPEEPVCDAEPGQDADCTANPVSDIAVVKSADPESGTELEDGQEVTYTVSFTNTGAGDGEIDYTDHMAGVLDDARVVEEPQASDEALSVESGDDSYTVTGALAGGAAVTVTYTVEVLDWADQGDHHLGNFITVTGDEAPEECAEDSPLCTAHPVVEPPAAGGDDGTDDEDEGLGRLPDTGTTVAGLALIAALLITGGAALTARRGTARPQH
ncbi:hypothetical protein GCM10023169_32050 [Georgenia halophila]|uniref:DUF7927 domain-containing protein n=1 Tax=Georgenia halophila TaxID=620889 RepID=A0ABP8LH17_9MICO